MSDNISTGSSSVPIRAEGDLQLQLRTLAPLKNARPHASRAGSTAPGDALKHILDSVPFTPSQGVRTPSPRQANDQRVARPSANPVFQFEDIASPPPIGHDLAIGQASSWSSAHIVPDHGGAGWCPSSPARPSDGQFYSLHHVNSPRSHSQASTSSGSPRAMQADTLLPPSGHMYPLPSNRQPSHRAHGQDQGPIRPLVHQLSRTTLASSFSAMAPFPPYEDLVPSMFHGNCLGAMPQERTSSGMSLGHRVSFPQPPRLARFPPVAPVPPLSESRMSGLRPDNRSFGHPSPPRALKSKKDLSGRAESSARHGTSTASSGSHGGMTEEMVSAVSASSGKQGMMSGRRDLDSGSTSTDSPNPGSPTQQVKSKIEVKLNSDGQLVFNARQRRTLRRALQRQRRQEISDGNDFSLDAPMSEAERRIVVEVVQMHIGRPLPACTNIDDLLRVLLSLGVVDPDG
eukprot:jgi/Ulvmu1/4375/UM002_0100.1